MFIDWLKSLIGVATKSDKYTLPDGWSEAKIAENHYVLNIPQHQKDAWANERRQKDNVTSLADGFHLKPSGRSGTIYYVNHNRICEIYVEMSGVKEFDILIYDFLNNQWDLPSKKSMTPGEYDDMIAGLKQWLITQHLKSDLPD